MFFKNIFLCALLVPFAVAGQVTDINTRIQELKRARVEKELELSELNEIISKKEQVIDQITTSGVAVYMKVLKLLSDQQKKQAFEAEVVALERALDEIFISKSNINAFLAKEWINADENKEEILRIKCAVIRCKVENSFLENLSKRYETCLCELFEIDQELNNLHKQISRN